MSMTYYQYSYLKCRVITVDSLPTDSRLDQKMVFLRSYSIRYTMGKFLQIVEILRMIHQTPYLLGRTYFYILEQIHFEDLFVISHLENHHYLFCLQ